MSHGYPDWGVQEEAFGLALLDVGEAVVRLGSPVSYRRGGKVVWLTGFEYGLQEWLSSAIGTNASVGVTSANTWRGALTAKLVPGSASNFQASITKRFPFVYTSKFGLEFTLWPVTNLQFLQLTLDRYDGAQLLHSIWQFRLETPDLQVFGEDGAYHSISSIPSLNNNLAVYHNVKMVVDWAKLKYDYVSIDKDTYDASAWGPYASADTTTAHMRVTFTAIDNDGTQAALYLDDIIVTVDEA